MKIFPKNLEELTGILRDRPDLTHDILAQMSASGDEAVARNGIALSVAALFRAGAGQAGLDLLVDAEKRFKLLPLPLFWLKFELRCLLDQEARLPYDYYEYGFNAARAGEMNLGLEALGTALALDTNLNLELLYDQRKMLAVAGVYEQTARLVAGAPDGHSRPPPAGQIAIGMVVPNLVDHTVAYSRRVLYFAEHLERARFRLNVYVTENMCCRSDRLPRLFFSQPTPVRAAYTLSRLRELDVPCHIADRQNGIVETAQELAGLIARDGVDILILQSGLAMPLDWLTVRLAPVPVKLQIHIGATAYLPGLYATLYDNEINMRRESALWPEDAGRQVLMRRGTDIEALDACAPLDPASFGVPADAVLIGTLSNHLEARLSPECCDVLCAVLEKYPCAWYAGIGGDGRPVRVMEHFRQRGVLGKAVFLPRQHKPGRALKALDVYANEFPFGGSQSVVEAMVCGLPVVAMRCGDEHHASVGADIVGPDFAVPAYDPAQYGAMLEKFVADQEARRQTGNAMRRRAEALFSVREFVRQVCAMGVDALTASRKA